MAGISIEWQMVSVLNDKTSVQSRLPTSKMHYGQGFDLQSFGCRGNWYCQLLARLIISDIGGKVDRNNQV